jgi:hypothetical protein
MTRWANALPGGAEIPSGACGLGTSSLGPVQAPVLRQTLDGDRRATREFSGARVAYSGSDWRSG